MNDSRPVLQGWDSHMPQSQSQEAADPDRRCYGLPDFCVGEQPLSIELLEDEHHLQ